MHSNIERSRNDTESSGKDLVVAVLTKCQNDGTSLDCSTGAASKTVGISTVGQLPLYRHKAKHCIVFLLWDHLKQKCASWMIYEALSQKHKSHFDKNGQTSFGSIAENWQTWCERNEEWKAYTTQWSSHQWIQDTIENLAKLKLIIGQTVDRKLTVNASLVSRSARTIPKTDCTMITIFWKAAVCKKLHVHRSRLTSVVHLDNKKVGCSYYAAND